MGQESQASSWVEAWNSACLSRCPRGERPLLELYLEPGGFSGRCTGESLPLRVDFIHRVEFEEVFGHRITPLHRNLQGLLRILSVKPASGPDLKALYDRPLLTSPRHLSSGPTLSPAWFTLRRPVFYTTKQVRASLVLFPLPRIFSPTPQLTEPALLFLPVSTSIPPSPRSLSTPPHLKQAFVTLYFNSNKSSNLFSVHVPHHNVSSMRVGIIRA